MQVNIQEAKAQFSRLLKRAAAGEEVIIARAGVPIAKVVAIEPKSKSRPLGIDRRVWVADDFDAPLPNNLLKEFYGGELPKLARRKKK